MHALSRGPSINFQNFHECTKHTLFVYSLLPTQKCTMKMLLLNMCACMHTSGADYINYGRSLIHMPLLTPTPLRYSTRLSKLNVTGENEAMDRWTYQLL